VTCWVLKFSKHAFYAWRKNPITSIICSQPRPDAPHPPSQLNSEQSPLDPDRPAGSGTVG
jgi:hypothetical protein